MIAAELEQDDWAYQPLLGRRYGYGILAATPLPGLGWTVCTSNWRPPPPGGSPLATHSW